MRPVDVTATINPADFRTDCDTLPSIIARDYAGEQYRKARELAAKPGAVVYISMTGSWSAEYQSEAPYNPGGKVHVTAYERLGYHTCTADLIRGWLDGGVRILSYRECDGATWDDPPAPVVTRTRRTRRTVRA